MQSVEEQVEALVASGLKGLGVAKLTKLDVEVLKMVASRIGASVQEGVSKDELVNLLLKSKRRAKASKSTCTASSGEPQPVPSLCKREEAPSAAPAEDAPKSVFKGKHSIEIVAFNALGLRLEKSALTPDLEEVFDRLRAADVLLLSEIPAGKRLFEERTSRLMSLMNKDPDEHWSMHVSDDRGRDTIDLHLVLVKRPLKVLNHVTTISAGDSTFDHPPMTVLLEDARFQEFTRFVVTCVHFPPESKRRQRDAQIGGFLDAYTTESTVRCGAPFTNKGAKDARAPLPTHVIAGDFNAWMGDERYNVAGCSMEAVFGSNMHTTSGKRQFDNFLVSTHTRNNFSMSTSVLELSRLQNSSKGILGASDHSPISLKLERSIS